MLVVFLVALVTVAGCFTEFFVRLVAAVTLGLFAKVSALEIKISQLMIEFFVIEFGSFEVAAFMLGMALLAFLSLFHAAVITLLFVHIFPNIFVAIHAHLRLRSLVEFLVALLAELFFLGMTFDDIARHQ